MIHKPILSPEDKDGIHDEAEQGGYRSNNERIGLGY